MAIHYYIYAVMHRTSGKIYIGAHGCSPYGNCHRFSEDCSYMGSGKALKRALRKYGRDAFIRCILSELPSENEMYELEAALVDSEFASHPETYNLCVGGRSGNTSDPDLHQSMVAKSHGWVRTPEYRQRMSLAMSRRFLNPKERQKMSEAMRGRYVSPATREKHRLAQLGKKYSDESREKMRLAKLGKYLGASNSNFKHGKCVNRGAGAYQFDTTNALNTSPLAL